MREKDLLLRAYIRAMRTICLEVALSLGTHSMASGSRYAPFEEVLNNAQHNPRLCECQPGGSRFTCVATKKAGAAPHGCSAGGSEVAAFTSTGRCFVCWWRFPNAGKKLHRAKAALVPHLNGRRRCICFCLLATHVAHVFVTALSLLAGISSYRRPCVGLHHRVFTIQVSSRDHDQ